MYLLSVDYVGNLMQYIDLLVLAKIGQLLLWLGMLQKLLGQLTVARLLQKLLLVKLLQEGYRLTPPGLWGIIPPWTRAWVVRV